MPTVDTTVCAEVQKRVEEHFDRNDKDIADAKEHDSKLEEVSIKMGAILEHLTATSADHETRIKELEAKPAKRYDYMVQVIIQYVLIALLAFMKMPK
jgi:hypothetical protein